jgi:hypothetical protein
MPLEQENFLTIAVQFLRPEHAVFGRQVEELAPQRRQSIANPGATNDRHRFHESQFIRSFKDSRAIPHRRVQKIIQLPNEFF